MSTYTLTAGQSQTLSFMPMDRDGEADQVNVSGTASLDATVTAAPASENLTVNLASGAHLTAAFHFVDQNTLTVNGDASTSVSFNGASDFAATASAYIQPAVLGTGTLTIGAAGELEFASSVASGITVDLNGNNGGSGVLAIDNPVSFSGAVNFNDGLLALHNLGTANSYSLSNGMLTIWGGQSGNQVLDTLRFTDSSPQQAGLSVSLLHGTVEVAEQTGAGPYGAGDALPERVTPPAPRALAVQDNTTGTQPSGATTPYTGPVAGIQQQFSDITSDNLNISCFADNLFISTGSGNDAIALHGGTNVVDAGTGSNFLVSGAGASFATTGSGFDTFFLDARNIPAASSAAGPVPGAIWDTIQGFGHGDAVTLWGITPGTALAWQKNEGAVGHTGLTLHANLTNGSEASLTLAGVDNMSHLALSYGQSGGANYLYVKAT